MNKDYIQSLIRLFLVLAAGVLAKRCIDTGGVNVDEIAAAVMVIVSAVYSFRHHGKNRAVIAELKNETEVLKKENKETKT